MSRVTFNEVALTATYRWKDPATGRARQESKKFFQTINPFNKNAQGQQKTREEITAELAKERDAWLAERAAAQGGQ